MMFMFFSIKYRYCVNMVSVTSASRYITSASHCHPCYQRRSSMYISSLIPLNFAESAEAVSDCTLQISLIEGKLLHTKVAIARLVFDS